MECAYPPCPIAGMIPAPKTFALEDRQPLSGLQKGLGHAEHGRTATQAGNRVGRILCSAGVFARLHTCMLLLFSVATERRCGVHLSSASACLSRLGDSLRLLRVDDAGGGFCAFSFTGTLNSREGVSNFSVHMHHLSLLVWLYRATALISIIQSSSHPSALDDLVCQHMPGKQQKPDISSRPGTRCSLLPIALIESFWQSS